MPRRSTTLTAVKIRVIEGRLVEAPNADASGVDRRAFGEFVSARGELASYAFGWETGQDHALMSIGIGAGNPGGGTFHTVMVKQDDDHVGFALADEPFETVPQGGPHLTPEEADAHDTLPFIWHVADAVLHYDRRAWWMQAGLSETLCTQTPQTAEQREPVLAVVHDADSGWHLTGATESGERVTRHLHHAVDEDQTLLGVLDLDPGQSARRRAAGGRWTRPGKWKALRLPWS